MGKDKTGLGRFSPQPIDRTIIIPESIRTIRLPEPLEGLHVPETQINLTIVDNVVTIKSNVNSYEASRKLQYALRTLVYEEPVWVDKLGATPFNPDVGLIVGRWMLKSKRLNLKTQGVTDHSTSKIDLSTTTFEDLDTPILESVLMGEKESFFKN